MRANIGRFCTYIKDCFVETDDIRSAASAPPLMAEPMTEGGHFRHPGGGGRLSATTKRSISAKQRQMTRGGHFRHPGGGGSRA